jgi:hypothetical protein
VAAGHCGTWKFYCVCPLAFKIIIYKYYSIVGSEAMQLGRKFLMVHKNLVMAVQSSETPAVFLETTQHHMPEGSHIHSHCYMNLISHV